MENGLHSLFQVKENVAAARDAVFIARKNHLLAEKSVETEIILIDAERELNMMVTVLERCEHAIHCTDATIDLLEMHFPGVGGNCRERFEELVMEANGTIDGVIYEGITCPSVNEILSNGGVIPNGYVYFDPKAHPVLEALWTVPKNPPTT
jgi:hypothetical protein